MVPNDTISATIFAALLSPEDNEAFMPRLQPLSGRASERPIISSKLIQWIRTGEGVDPATGVVF